MEKQLACVIALMKQEETFYKRIGKGMNLTDYNSIFQRTCRRGSRVLFSAIELWQGSGVDERCASAIDFYLKGASFTIANWMISMKESPESVAKTIVDCMPAYLGEAMDKAFAAYHRNE